MKPKKPKKREVTMWAIWSPYDGLRECSTASNRKDAWTYHLKGACQLTARKNGYRAVKGKFVWEEK